jgi:DNA-binding NarL/FixJ family response regulator
VTVLLPIDSPPGPAPAPAALPAPSDVPAERRALVGDLVERAARPGTRTLLVGEPGIGRTTVLDLVVRQARARGVQVLHARASADRDQPFHGLIDLLRGVPRCDVEALPPLQRTAVDVALARRAADPALPAAALPAGVTTLLATLVDRGPVCLAVDDWPLLDPETAELLRHVLRRPGPGGRLPSLMATQRLVGVLSGSRDTVEHALFSPADVLPVPSLTVGSLDALVTARTGRRRSAAVLGELYRLTGGNPLWSAELSHPQLGRPGSDAVSLPGSVTPMLAARIRALSPGARRALATVAALGSATPATVLALGPDLRSGLAAAADAEVLRLTDRGWEPTHPLLGAAVLESLGARGRRTLHTRVALVVPTAAERAHHQDLATVPGPAEDVAAAFDAAAAESRARGATATALDQAGRALARSEPDTPGWLRRTVTAAELALAVGDLDLVVEPLRRLTRAPLPTALLDRALPVLLDALVLTSGEAAATAELAELAGTLPATLLTDAVLDAHRAADRTRPVADRRASAERAVAALAGGRSAPHTLHRALTTLLEIGLDEGEGLSEELLDQAATAEEAGPPASARDRVQVLRAAAAVQREDLPVARAELEQLLAQSRAAGEQAVAAAAAVQLATVVLLGGEPGRAAALLADAEQWSPVPVPPEPLRQARGLLALARGDEQAPDTDGGWTSPALRGIAAARAGDWAAALLLLTTAHTRAEAAGVRDPARRLWLDAELGQTLCALDRPDEARVLADRLAALDGRAARPLLRGQERRLRALVAAAEGDLAAAEELLGGSVDVLAGSGFPAEHGRSLLELGRLLRRRRARARARQVLERARDIALRAGDVPLQRRLTRELAGPGSPAGTDGPGRLTAAEQRVADAVATGASNREIAAAQFISVRTVESHLASVYRKLGVHADELHPDEQLAAGVQLPRPR